MITLTAKIELLQGNNNEITTTYKGVIPNNISKGIDNVIGTKKKGSNPFLLGVSTLGSGATLSNEVEYYIGARKSNENGVFVSPYEFQFDVKSIKNLTFVFDDFNKQYPPYVIVNDVRYENDDPYFTITGLKGEIEQIRISIPEWNTPNYPLRMLGIYADLEIEIDRRNLISLNSPIFSRTETDLPSWGIISNSGSVTFNDTTGEILDYIENGLLKEGLTVTISINNTLSNKKEVIGTFGTSEWDYDNDNRKITVSFEDDLKQWQDINIEGISYDPRNPVSQPLSYFYKYLYDFTIQNGYKIKSFVGLDFDTVQVLDNNYVRYPLLDSSNLWSAWNKLCEVAQCYMYQEKDGTINFVYRGK